jgi:hypothetical protein
MGVREFSRKSRPQGQGGFTHYQLLDWEERGTLPDIPAAPMQGYAALRQLFGRLPEWDEELETHLWLGLEWDRMIGFGTGRNLRRLLKEARLLKSEIADMETFNLIDMLDGNPLG